MPSQGGEECWGTLSQGVRAHTGQGGHLCRMAEPKLPGGGRPQRDGLVWGFRPQVEREGVRGAGQSNMVDHLGRVSVMGD